MDDNSEDRENELAALESIYEHHLKIIKSDGLQKFSVDLEGHTGQSKQVKNACRILFQYTNSYPNGAPEFEIEPLENFSDSDVAVLTPIIESVIKRSLGYIMIFDILSEVQEKLNSICERQLMLLNKAAEQKRKAREQEEEAKFHGDRVTVESFLAWNAKFIAEMSALETKKVVDDTTKRLTGRELFLQDNRYDVSDLNFLETEGGDVVEVDERLFSDIGDIDLEDEFDENNTVEVEAN